MKTHKIPGVPSAKQNRGTKLNGLAGQGSKSDNRDVEVCERVLKSRNPLRTTKVFKMLKTSTCDVGADGSL